MEGASASRASSEEEAELLPPYKYNVLDEEYRAGKLAARRDSVSARKLPKSFEDFTKKSEKILKPRVKSQKPDDMLVLKSR